MHSANDASCTTVRLDSQVQTWWPIAHCSTLSCASQLESTSQADEFEVHLLVQISKERADEFKRETGSDPVLPKLKKVILTGWPENRSEVEPELQGYWNFRDELCISDGLLMKVDRLITPYSLRDEMLEKIHGSHLGVEKCLSRAREGLFWPNISKNIKVLLRSSPWLPFFFSRSAV